MKNKWNAMRSGFCEKQRNPNRIYPVCGSLVGLVVAIIHHKSNLKPKDRRHNAALWPLPLLKVDHLKIGDIVMDVRKLSNPTQPQQAAFPRSGKLWWASLKLNFLPSALPCNLCFPIVKFRALKVIAIALRSGNATRHVRGANCPGNPEKNTDWNISVSRRTQLLPSSSGPRGRLRIGLDRGYPGVCGVKSCSLRHY